MALHAIMEDRLPAPEAFAISCVVAAETFVFAAKHPMLGVAVAEAELVRNLPDADVLPFTRRMCGVFAQLALHAPSPRHAKDHIIVATALVHGADLWTGDRRLLSLDGVRLKGFERPFTVKAV